MVKFGEISRIGIYGAGISNEGVLGLIRRSGASPKVTLRSDKPISVDEIRRIGADISLFGSMAKEGFTEDVLFLSPSVRADGISPPERCRISSDSELFFESFPEERTLAVTGTDGKSTTTELISLLLTASGLKTARIGNCGVALSDAVFCDADMAVAELSSFQLMQYTPRTFRAVITNITENHLDMHKSFEEYAEAKLGIADKTQGLVYDADCELLSRRFSDVRAFSVCSFSKSFEELSGMVSAENYITCEDGYVCINGKPRICKSNLCRAEEYNVRNIMLALGATLGIIDENSYGALYAFEGLSHRARTVFQDGDISYIDSSIDSTPHRSAQTLSSMSGRCAVIICGRGKRLSYAPILDVLYKKCVCAVLLGEAGDELYALAKDDERYRDFKFIKCSDMTDATRAARDFVKKGTVLLSPAATSFDRYKNYEERGDDFKRAATLLSKEK